MHKIQIKSLFISAYLTFMALISGYAVLGLVRGGNRFAWLGVMLASGPMLARILTMMVMKNTARTSGRFPLINGVGAVGVTITLIASMGAGGPLVAVGLAAFSWLGFLAYSYWYSSFGGRSGSTALRIGSRLPAVTFRNLEGAEVSTSDLIGQTTVFLFYRGNWCPLCMAQIKEIAAQYRQLADMGVRVVLVSPQPATHSVALARQHDVPFEFLSDPDCQAAKVLGIVHEGGLPAGMQMFGYDSNTVLPTMLVTNPAGELVWKDETDNYRVRPEPQTLMDVLRRQQLVA